VSKNGVDAKDGFVYPSYFEDIMGPIFDYGYGPFRWVCLSGKPEDLDKTDAAAMSCIDPDRRSYDRDNYVWIRDAKQNRLVVGSQARILYQDAEGRVSIALKFNKMVRTGEVCAPIMLGRDHHDPGGTDSPFRETANIHDGSNVCADMATHCFAGNAARGMSMVVVMMALVLPAVAVMVVMAAPMAMVIVGERGCGRQDEDGAGHGSGCDLCHAFHVDSPAVRGAGRTVPGCSRQE